MTANTARMEFAPPHAQGLVRALTLAILAHGLLLMVLTLGVQWKRDPVPVTVEAELWSALPVEAAPPPAPEPPPVEPEPEPVRIPKPVVAPPPPVPDPSIAVAQEKARLQKQQQLQQEQQREQEQRQKDALKAKKLKEEKDTREREQREKLARDKKLQLEQQRVETAKQDAETKKLAELRKQQIDRMNRLAGQAVGSGSPESTGTARQSSGPSASYGGRIQARVRPNITYTESISGNPAAEVEVRTSPDGTIISRKLVKSSGVKSWDDAVLNAIDKTEVLPKDVDGRVPSALTLVFRPKD